MSNYLQLPIFQLVHTVTYRSVRTCNYLPLSKYYSYLSTSHTLPKLPVYLPTYLLTYLPTITSVTYVTVHLDI